MGWIEGQPVEGILAPDLNDVIRDNNAALEAALDAYIRFATGGTQSGQPRQGSARPYFQDSAPTARLDGAYFDSTDFGTVWIDSNSSPDNQLNFLSAADGAGTETWTPISTEVIAVLVAQINTWALAQTFSVSPVFTKGIVANNAYLQGRNAAGSANIDMIKVNGSNGLTLGAVTTIPDTSALATSGAPVENAEIANKKYVDDEITAIVGAAGTLHTHSSTAVHSGAVANDWSTQLDLSSIVGANAARVTLSCLRTSGSGAGYLAARAADDSRDYKIDSAAPQSNVASSNTNSTYGQLTAVTKSDGILDLKTNSTINWDVWLIDWIR